MRQVEDLEQERQEISRQITHVHQLMRRLSSAKLLLIRGENVAVVHFLEMVLENEKKITGREIINVIRPSVLGIVNCFEEETRHCNSNAQPCSDTE